MPQDIVLTLEYKKMHWFWRALLWLLLIFFISIAVLFFYLNFKVNQLTKDFATGANLEKAIVLQQANNFIKDVQMHYQDSNTPKKYTFLILGTDQLSGRANEGALSDTMIIAQLNLLDGKLKLLSLPRDLYHQTYQTRINALYFYGQEKSPENPAAFPKQAISEMTGLTIDHILVIDIENLEKLIKLVEPLEIDVPTAFTDEKFPRPGVDVSQERDPKILYETIHFAVGKQEMDAATAMKYMRSRHSGDDQGTDEARAMRQQLVLQALANKLSQQRSPQILGELYRFYLDQFASQITPQELAIITAAYLRYLETATTLIPVFTKHQLNIYPEDPNGVIVNPPLWQTKGQWIYQIRDEQQFKEYVKAIFN